MLALFVPLILTTYMNVLGQVLVQHEIKVESGFNRIEFNLKSITSGFYAFNILNKDGLLLTHKLVKE